MNYGFVNVGWVFCFLVSVSFLDFSESALAACVLFYSTGLIVCSLRMHNGGGGWDIGIS